jgi:hypothetical protein
MAVPSNTATERVAKLFAALPELVGADADLMRRGRFLTCEFEIGIGNLPLSVSVAAGRIAQVARGPFLLKPYIFAIRMPAEAWLEFLAPVPKPGWHDIMALSKRGIARIEGNLQPFMANLQYMKDVLAAPRVDAGAET